MSATGQFTGLPMPVFTAFGWAGEENAINFALDQLETFITQLHLHLSREAKTELPYYGIDREARTVYLSAKRDVEEGPYIAFLARPITFEMKLSVTDKAVINRGLRAADKNPKEWYRYLSQLGESWYFHLQQVMVDEESGEESFYQDLYKDSVTNLDFDTCQKITSRAAFLNSEAKWVTPVHISYRLPSEQAATMKKEIVSYISSEIDRLMTILFLFTHSSVSIGTNGKEKSKKSKAKKAAQKAKKNNVAQKISDNSFTYMSELKPLHIRRGFINLTKKHWPFFANSARSETREVTVFFDGRNGTCTVWRLQPNDMARLVLTDEAQVWLENNFSPDSLIMVHATRVDDNEIQVRLTEPE